MSPLEWLASQGAPAATTAKGSGNDVVPSNWTDMVPASKIGQASIQIPKGNYKEIPNPLPGGTGTWYLLRPSPPTKWEFNPIKTMWWEPAPQNAGAWLSPQIGDNRKGTIVTKFVDKNGKIPAAGVLSKWLKSLPQAEYDAWYNGTGGGGGGPRWAYKEKGSK